MRKHRDGVEAAASEAPCGPLLKQRCLATPGSNLLRRSSSFLLQAKKNLLQRSRFLKWSAREDNASLREAPCGPLLKQRCLATPGSNLLRRSSSFLLQAKKNLLQRSRFLKWSAREDDASLREAPCGALLKQRCLATPGSNLLRRFSSFLLQTKKNLLQRSRFLKWSAREDSNLRPSGPKPDALPSCATRRFFILFCLVRREGLEPSRPLRH